MDVAAYYENLRARQMDHGHPFQGIVELRAGEDEALAKIRLPDDVSDDGYVIHPALLDTCLQLFAAVGVLSGDTTTYVPVRISRVHLHQRPGREAWVHVTKSQLEELARDVRIVDELGRVLVAIDGVSMQRLDRVTQSADPLAHCVYDVAWREVKPPAQPSFSERGTWLVFVDRAGLGDVLIARLSRLGQRCIRIVPGSSYTAISPDEIRIDVGKPEEYRRIFKETFGDEGHCAGVVFLSSLDATPFEQTTTETLTQDLAHATVSATYLAQAIVHHGFRNAPRLFLVTRGVQSVLATDPISVSQAPILGLGKTIAMEHPELRCTRIDLPARGDERDVESLLREFGSRDREDQIALRGGTRHVARLAPGKLAAADALRRIRVDRTYLITGGLGGLGLSLAQWLVEQGARSLVLAGRKGPTEHAMAAIQSMEQVGARVHCAQVDVSRASEVEKLFSRIRDEMPPLGGIVHAAMVLDDHMLLEQSQDSFVRAFAPKALGAWNLHKYSVDTKIEFFVMYSSATGLIGSPGQANYCASNAYLDALCRERVRLGLPAVSIQWGGFAEVGAAAALDIRGNRLSLRGMMSLLPAEGLDAFQRLLGHPRPEVGIVRFDPRQWVEFYPSAAGIPFFAEVMQRDAGQKKAPTGKETLARLQAARPDERFPILERHLLDHVSAVLHLDATRIERTVPLQSFGMDSLMSLELRNRIEASLGVRLSATVLFTHSTVSALGGHLMKMLAFADHPAEPKAEPERVIAHATTDHGVEIDDIAVIGMACRFPAGGVDPNAFWRALEAGADGIRRIPVERWPANAIDSDNPATRWAGLLDAVDQFDPAFFSISPREANLMDPQQRLLLEVSWEAMENAGHAMDRLVNDNVGVYVGIMRADYAQMVRKTDSRDMYGGIGNLHSVAAGRLSYTFGLQGPSMTVDTACSSSLVAVHLACQSLRNHDSDLALAGGVNAILDPQTMVMTAAMQALAPDGRCKTFDAEANGFVRGEGCGVVVLKRLSEAKRDGDRILAVIRGSVVNQDGRSTGLTAPNVLSQQAMLRRALKVARIQPEDIGYVETHGTGTPLGDPIEFEAMREVLGKPRNNGSRCVLGALKTNVGHMEGAAGIGGLIKAILCLQHEAIPKNLNFTTLNPRMAWEGTPFVIPTEKIPWKSSGKPRRAGVSSFGISGTNAHVILEEAPRQEEKPSAQASSYLLPLSAKSPEALVVLAKSYQEWLTTNDEPLHHVAYTAGLRRSHLEHRLSVTGTKKEDIALALGAFAAGEMPPGVVTGQAAQAAPKVVFVFPGQGSQWVGMGRQLYREEPVFRDALVACDEAIRNEAGFSVIEELHNAVETSRISDIDVVQPVLFAVEVALAALWRSWGVQPSAVVGHSMGEVAAAFVAGALSLKDAAAVICRRSRLLRRVRGQGAMALVELSLPNAENALVGYEDRLSVAVSNGPRSTVIAGDPAALDAVLGKLEKDRVFCRRVKVDVASHSPQMDPLRGELLASLAGISPQNATIPIRSTVTGELVRGEELSAMYWADNLRRPVLFSRVVEQCISEQQTIFLEMSPHPILMPSVEENLQSAKIAGLALGSTRRDQSEIQTIRSSLGALHVHGVPIDWKRLYPDGGRVVALPAYPWQKQRYWIESPKDAGITTLAPADALRGAGVDTPDNAFYQWEQHEAPLLDAVPSAPERWILVARANSERTIALSETLRGAILTTPANLGQTLVRYAPAVGLVCLWDVAADEPAPDAALRLCTEALAIVQALQRHSFAPRRLIWATTNAVAESAESASVAMSALWGLGRVIMQEAPELGLSLVDMPPGQSILPELSANDGENQVVWRGEKRLVMRLVRATVEDGRSVSISKEGTVLITGGLGALGLLIAKWLAAKGVPHLVLTGRRGMDTPGASEAIAEISALGAQVTVANTDVADRSALQCVLERIPAQWPLRGVIHAAVVLDDGVIAEQNPARFARVFAPKAVGAWNLHELTKSHNLDFFVLFSSVAGLIGTAGQSNYAAANTFLDALAAYRRQMGLAGQSLAWGAWAEIGKAAELDASKQARLERLGILSISPEDGLTLFERALGCNDAYLGIVSFDLRRMADSFGQTIPPMWRALVHTPTMHAPTPERAPEAREAQLASLSLEQRAKEIRAIVHTEVARVLGMHGSVPGDKPFRELGLDSLMAVELRNALGRRFNRTLSATLAFDYPTIEALSRWLLEDVLQIAPQRAALVEAPAPIGLDEPIAIVGMGCRFPGGITDADSFWHLLDGGIDAITEIPRARWDVDAFYDSNPEAQGKMVTRSGGFISQIDHFDTAFFGISPREATTMDPQQRLVLETSWEALEHAGIAPDRLVESDTGVFVGQVYQEYANLIDRIDEADGYSLTGAATSVTSGRISYFFGLKGPSLTVDTACSSSLVSVHLACQSLRRGECSTALAGGVTLMLTPAIFVQFSRMRGLSVDGRCKSFSAAADGTGWGEGCGMVVLKRLSDAKRDGQRILAVIRSSVVNQDGRSNGLTAPNGPSQRALITQAVAHAGLRPADIGYVECHGTGTTLGDPIEAQALGAALAEGRAPDAPVIIGSVKSNIGHTQAAAGIAGLMKTVLTLQHGRIPKTLHVDAPSPHIPWSELPLKIAAEPVDWPRTPSGAPRFAGVSSFGISGTNAHIILEEAPHREEKQFQEASSYLLPLSAKTPEALSALARAYQKWFAHHDEPLHDVAYTASLRRSHLEHRLTVEGAKKEEIANALLAYAAGEFCPAVVTGKAPPTPRKVAFVFSGQGSQWIGMGRQLSREEPVFREALVACDEAIRKEAGISVLEELDKPEETSRLHETVVAQPALFALEVALSVLLRSWGITPSVVIGHSVGEIAAAHVAGMLDLAQAARLVSIRARVMQEATGRGKMVLVSLDEPLAREAIAGLEDRVGIAAVNDPHSVVLSGDAEVIDWLVEKFTQNGVQTRQLRVNYAFHSPHMDSLRGDFIEALGVFEAKPGTIPMLSTVTGQSISEKDLTAEYWAQNIRQTVRFAEAISSASSDGCSIFVEIGPHPVLAISIEETLAAGNAESNVIATLRREKDERKQAFLALGALHVQGCTVDWSRFYRDGGRLISLPTYPWQRERYWVDSLEANSRGDGAALARETTLRAELLTAPPEQRLTLLGSFLTRELGHVLRVDSAKIPLDASMFQLGVDSLMRLELRKRIAVGLGFEPSMVALSRHDHIAELAAYLLERVLPAASMDDIPSQSAETNDVPADMESYTF